MMNTVNKKEIYDFIESWSTGAHEVGDKSTFWNTILRFLGVPQEQIDNRTFIDYEKKIKLKKNEHFDGSIDGYIPSTHVLIEQKSSGVDLNKPEYRPNGGHTEKITPYQQARRYDTHLSANERAYFYVLCNFDEFIIYDIRESVDTKPVVIKLKDLVKDLHILDFLVKKGETPRIQQEQQVSVKAGNLVSKIYNELADIFNDYKQLDNDKVKHSINSLCVRLVFCLYAEDAGLFGPKEDEVFYNYLKDVEPNQIGLKLKELFQVLNTKIEDRDKTDAFWTAEHPKLAQFPYVNGGLFADESIFIPPFTQELKDIVLKDASKGFNWSAISPTVFGAVFESTLNPDTRRKGGMHYTSVENIHKVIDPLFLNDLQNELIEIKKTKQPATLKKKAAAYQEKLANLTFFDPACGSGNFLTETYLQLRKLENEAIRLQYTHTSTKAKDKVLSKFYSENIQNKQDNLTSTLNSVIDTNISKDVIKVSIQQFYGIEINDFAVSVAKTALWIAESQMWEETKDIFFADWDFLPLKTYTHIHEGNALRMDWNKVIPNYACHYIMGNPPFIGLSSLPAKDKELKKQQRQDMNIVFKDLPKKGKLDYVSAWYEKAVNYIDNISRIKVAFVSTNSITQGEQVGILWRHLIGDENVKINFAYRSFVWINDTKNMAHVHCVIIGFSVGKDSKNKFIVNEDGIKAEASHINGYLIDYHDIYIQSRKKELPYGLPEMHKGSQPTDGGGLTLKSNEAAELIKKYPQLKECIKPYIGSYELINDEKRYCLWLENINPKIYRKIPEIIKRLHIVVKQREKSTTGTVRLNDVKTPYLFTQIRQPKVNYIAVPEVSSENREYIPIAFLSKDIIASNKLYLIPSDEKWIFAILTSSIHMAWMRTVAGRLETRYSYSPAVYSNFPWLNPTKAEKDKLSKTAQGIFDARVNHPDSSLADLYDPLTMPVDLRKAHRANDKAVLQTYRLPVDSSEADIVAHLFKMYEDLTK